LSEPQIDAVAKRFYRHWTTQAGQKAVKRNWERVWDNWVDNEIDKYGLKPAGNTKATADARKAEEDWRAARDRILAEEEAERC